MVIGKVKCLSPEFQLHALVNRKLLEERHIKILKTGTSRLVRTTTEWRGYQLAYLSCNGGICECVWIEPLVNIVWTSIDVLSRHNICKASKICRCCNRTADCERLSGLVRIDKVRHPSAYEGICNCIDVTEKRLFLPERQVIGF